MVCLTAWMHINIYLQIWHQPHLVTPHTVSNIVISFTLFMTHLWSIGWAHSHSLPFYESETILTCFLHWISLEKWYLRNRETPGPWIKDWNDFIGCFFPPLKLNPQWDLPYLISNDWHEKKSIPQGTLW